MKYYVANPFDSLKYSQANMCVHIKMDFYVIQPQIIDIYWIRMVIVCWLLSNSFCDFVAHTHTISGCCYLCGRFFYVAVSPLYHTFLTFITRNFIYFVLLLSRSRFFFVYFANVTVRSFFLHGFSHFSATFLFLLIICIFYLDFIYFVVVFFISWRVFMSECGLCACVMCIYDFSS